MRISNPGRRWSIAVLGALLAATPALADDPKPKAVANTVKLDLQISGLGGEGWKLEIKPAHPGSRFKPVARPVPGGGSGGPARLETIAIDARSLSADRDCAFAIVLTGPDGQSQTFKRSVRLSPQQGEAVPEVSKTFYLRTTTVATRDRPRGDR